MMRKCPVRFGGGPGEKAETSDLACGLPYPAGGRGSPRAFGLSSQIQGKGKSALDLGHDVIR